LAPTTATVLATTASTLRTSSSYQNWLDETGTNFCGCDFYLNNFCFEAMTINSNKKVQLMALRRLFRFSKQISF